MRVSSSVYFESTKEEEETSAQLFGFRDVCLSNIRFYNKDAHRIDFDWVFDSVELRGHFVFGLTGCLLASFLLLWSIFTLPHFLLFPSSFSPLPSLLPPTFTTLS